MHNRALVLEQGTALRRSKIFSFAGISFHSSMEACQFELLQCYLSNSLGSVHQELLGMRGNAQFFGHVLEAAKV